MSTIRTFWNLRPNGIPYIPPLWIGWQTGIYSVSNTLKELYSCYFPLDVLKVANVAYRLPKFSYGDWVMTVDEVTTVDNKYLPEI